MDVSLSCIWHGAIDENRHWKFGSTRNILQCIRIARNADRCNSRGCPSVTFHCFVQKNEGTIVRSSVSGRTIILVSWDVKFIRVFAGSHRSESVKMKRPLVAIAKIWPIIGHNLECKLALINRKSHMSFRLVLKLLTLNNPERCNGPYFVLFRRIR